MGAHMDGREGLKIALQSHGPIDALTHHARDQRREDPLRRHAREGHGGDRRAPRHRHRRSRCRTRHGGFAILVICPPPVLEQGPIAVRVPGRARGVAARCPRSTRRWREARGVRRSSTPGTVIEVSPTDGIHFEPEAHAALGAAVAEAVRAL